MSTPKFPHPPRSSTSRATQPYAPLAASHAASSTEPSEVNSNAALCESSPASIVITAGVVLSLHVPMPAAPRCPSVMSVLLVPPSSLLGASPAASSLSAHCSECDSHCCSQTVASATRQCCQSSLDRPSVTSMGKQASSATTSRRSVEYSSRQQSASPMGASPRAVRCDHLLPVTSPRAVQPLMATHPCQVDSTRPTTRSPWGLTPATVLPLLCQQFPARVPCRG